MKLSRLCLVLVVLLGVLAVNSYGTLVTFNEAPYWGYVNAGIVYAQDTPPIGVYGKAVGQTFMTPTVGANEALALKAFSTVFTGDRNYAYGHVKYTLRSWDAATSTPGAAIYEYETQNDVYHVGDQSDIRVRPGSGWMHNGDNATNRDWLFRNWDFGTTTISGNTMYYWEVEVLNSVYPPTPLDWIKLGWGTAESGSASGNWTTGAAYQRFSDGSVAQLLPEYGPCDLNFKMEFEVVEIPEPATIAILLSGLLGLVRYKR